MTENQIMLIVAAIVAGAIYPVAQILWTRFMQPMRLRFADEGIKLLNSPELGENEKEIVDALLDDAFDWKFAIEISVKFIPLMLLKDQIESHPAVATKKAAFESFANRDEVQKFISLHIVCVLGSNPIFALLFLVQLLFVGLVVGGISSAMRAVERRVVGPLATT